MVFLKINQIYEDCMRYSGLSMVLSDEYQTGKKSVYRLIYLVTIFSFVISNIICTIVLFDQDNNFGDKTLKVSAVFNSTLLAVRIVTMIHYRNVYQNLVMDFTKFQSNLHRPSYSALVLFEATALVKRVKKIVLLQFNFGLFIWYFLPILLSAELKGIIRGDGTRLVQIIDTFPTLMPAHLRSEKLPRYLFEVCLAFAFVWTYGPFDVLMFTFSYLIKTQFEILKNSLKCSNRFIIEGDNSRPMKYELFVKDHQKLLKAARNLRVILSPLVGAQLFVTVFALGCSSYSITSPPPDGYRGSVYMHYFMFILYIIMVLPEMYVFCWFSHMVDSANEELGDAIFGSAWYMAERRTQKDWMFSIFACQRPINFQAFGMVDINMETFLSVVRVSYSYCTLMQQT